VSGRGSGGGGRPAAKGARSKSGKPRPGTGGYGRRSLEGKGPTPPAHLRPGHPAQRRAAEASRTAGSPRPRDDDSAGRGGGRAAAGRSTAARGAAGQRAAGGDVPEMVVGRNSVVEALRARVPAVALYVELRASADDKVREAVRIAADAGVPVIETRHAELDRLTGGAVHQGVALRVRAYDYASPEDLPERASAAGQLPLIVALDGVTDPRNLGAVARSAAAFGGHGVLVPARRSAGVTAGAWKSSAGALARVPVARAANLVRALTAYQEAGIFVAGLDAEGDATVADMPVADAPLTLVVGSEGRGLSRLVAERCDLIVRIPMAGGTESLNAGVAAGIALYEVTRRRNGSGH
jgi:23S rRNA (guanosine2251-2'-O)-methyltransferase